MNDGCRKDRIPSQLYPLFFLRSPSKDLYHDPSNPEGQNQCPAGNFKVYRGLAFLFPSILYGLTPPWYHPAGV